MRALILTLSAFIATTAHAGWFFDDCQAQAARTAVQPAAGVTRVVIIARAGFLHVEGHPGATEIRASGQACAASESQLSGIVLSGTRSGNEVRIEAVIPHENDSFFSSSPKLDFTVTLPAGIAVDIADTSGEMTISNVGNAKINDTSGGIDVRHVTGNLTVRDTSGGIDIEDVTGDVLIPSDTSGSIDIHGVGGSVTIDEDGSGSVEIRHVKRNVLIGTKGSGSVSVADVGGDFTVREKGSGSIDYERVSGRISVPDRHRHRD
jgi:hypothetical protein